ncbi:TetR/AcrR family transcriptional regulator [Bradyrhizobium cenepequi]
MTDLAQGESVRSNEGGAVASNLGKKSGKIKRSEQTRRRILDAAALWLNKKGLAVTSLQDLADEVGLQTASLYYHFPSKDALIEEVLHKGIEIVYDDVRRALDALGPGATYRERIRVAIATHLSSLLAHGDYTSANIRNFPLAPDNLREKNTAIRRQYADYWRQLFQDAQKAGEIAPNIDLSLVRLLLIGAMNWSTEWFNPRKKSIDMIADTICNVLFDGIAPKDAQDAGRNKRYTRR